ncbi:MAG: DsbA family protein [Myxococcales bacterium]|nr:DsbA family protein [Myxococcales bacterium]
MRRILVLLIPLLVLSCRSGGTPRLEEQVARLRIEVDELKAKNAEAEQRAASDATSARAPMGDDRMHEEMLAELAALREAQAQLEATVDARPSAPAARPARPRPDPAAVYSQEIADAPFLGVRNAKVTIVKNFEFDCRFCNKADATMAQLLKDYKGELKIAYKHFIVHPSTATEPAHASCAAGMQGKFKKMKKLIWEHAFGPKDFSRKNLDLEGLARKANLRMARFRADRDGACVARVKQDQEQARAVGVTGTPAFYINGRFLSGARPLDQFKKLIDEELAKARARISGGEATAANYYQRFVLDAGLKKLATP